MTSNELLSLSRLLNRMLWPAKQSELKVPPKVLLEPIRIFFPRSSFSWSIIAVMAEYSSTRSLLHIPNLFRWQYTVTILIWVTYSKMLARICDCEVQYPHRCGEWLPHIHLKTLDSSALEPCQLHARKIIPLTAAVPAFQTEMATKRQNLQAIALSFHFNLNFMSFSHLFSLKREVFFFFFTFV